MMAITSTGRDRARDPRQRLNCRIDQCPKGGEKRGDRGSRKAEHARLLCDSVTAVTASAGNVGHGDGQLGGGGRAWNSGARFALFASSVVVVV
jgi:hypothetical protein